MPTFVQRLLARDWRPGQAATAGLAATATYSVAMETDKYITDNHFNDVTFIQGLLGDSDASSQGTEALAWGIHFLNGVMLAELYAAVGKRLLPGPNWLKGTLFGSAFIIAVWPLTPLVDRYHPMVKNGRLPHLANWTSFWQNVLRHMVFGLTLGLLYRQRSR
ncbi:MAG TPA: DUF6789 family protein [Ktedonobacteraceae bacterium]|nr:DUF6789 family protein [Ktedonobacteraceae bacterium]